MYKRQPAIPVPEGFAVCDGSAIADAESPFNGLTTPDLRDRFIYGTDSVGAIQDAAGGSATMNLSHSHGMSHNHSGTTGASNNDTTVLGGCPIGCSEKDGVPDFHTHNFTTGPSSSSTTGPGLSSMSVLPPFARLLKIVRIK